MDSKRIWYLLIIIVFMFAALALIPCLSSGDNTSLTAFEELLALDFAIIVLGYLFFYLRTPRPLPHR